MWVQYAGAVGMDVEKFKTDIAGIQTKERVDQDMQRGRNGHFFNSYGADK